MKKSTNKIVKTKFDKPQMKRSTERKGNIPSFPQNVKLDIELLEEETTPQVDDLLLMRSTADKVRKKIKYSNL